MAAPLSGRSDRSFRNYRPPAPAPHAKQLGLLRLISTLRRNPLECWAREHFEKLVVTGGLPVGHAVIINHPAAIRRVLLENAANYRKDALQRRVLSAGLGEGLLSAEGLQWRAQRRTVAALFARRTITQFAPAMMDAANALVERWHQRCDATLDVAAEMARLTLDVLERTIFSEGFGCNAEEARRAMMTYFNTVGRIDPLDLLGMPNWIPRINHLRVRSTLRFFERSIEDLIAARRRRLAERADGGPNDILALLLAALDPDTGERMSEAEVKSNILTFIMAGHETTANLLSWSLFLLSQSDDWRQRVRAEAEHEVNGSVTDLAERLPETRAVIEEAARLYPPIAAISRVAIDADELADEAIPAGTLVVISPYVPPPAQVVVARSGYLRAQSISRRKPFAYRPLFLSALRGRSAHVCRIDICIAGSHDHVGHRHQEFQVAARSRPQGVASTARHVEARRGASNDHPLRPIGPTADGSPAIGR